MPRVASSKDALCQRGSRQHREASKGPSFCSHCHPESVHIGLKDRLGLLPSVWILPAYPNDFPQRFAIVAVALGFAVDIGLIRLQFLDLAFQVLDSLNH